MSFSPANYDENHAFWKGRVEKTELQKDLTVLSKVAGETARGNMRKSQFVSGIPGVGKTYCYETVFQKAGRAYTMVKSGTVLGILSQFEACAKKGEVALLDDPKRNILRDDDFLNALMAATGPEPRVYTHAIDKTKRTYRFSGSQIVVLTNYRLQSRGSNRKISELLAPLMTRVWSCQIEGSRQEIFDHACYLAICCDMLRRNGANLIKANIALRYFAENMHRLPDVSARTLVKIVELMNDMPSCWQEAMDRECLQSGEYSRPYAGEMPRIILSGVKTKLMPTKLSTMAKGKVMPSVAANRQEAGDSRMISGKRKASYEAVAQMYAQGRSIDEIVAAFDNPSVVHGLLEQNGFLGAR